MEFLKIVLILSLTNPPFGARVEKVFENYRAGQIHGFMIE